MKKGKYMPKRVEDILLESSELKLPRRFKKILTDEIRRERSDSYWLRDRGDYLANDCYAHFELKLATFVKMPPAKFRKCVKNYIKNWLAKKENKESRALATGYDEENDITYVNVADILNTEDEATFEYLSRQQESDDQMDLDEYIFWCKTLGLDHYISAYLSTGDERKAAESINKPRSSWRDTKCWLEKKFAEKLAKEKKGQHGKR